MEEPSRHLEDMSLEELWQLFPVFLVPHRPEWKLWFEEEKAALLDLLADVSPSQVHHIGSTAIPGIWAKNIVDILMELPSSSLDWAAETLTRNGWILMSRDGGRISLNKGYTERGFDEKVFHLHLRITGDHDALYFRDYLLDHPDEAKRYETLKLELWKKFPHDRDAYTRAKTDFVLSCTKKAHSEYDGRYE